jgi:hypothetical protein
MQTIQKQEEQDFQNYLESNKFHPLNYMSISEIKLIGKTKDFKLYEFFNEDAECFQTLKVMSDMTMFNKEKEILMAIKDRRIAVPMQNDF